MGVVCVYDVRLPNLAPFYPDKLIMGDIKILAKARLYTRLTLTLNPSRVYTTVTLTLTLILTLNPNPKAKPLP